MQVGIAGVRHLLEYLSEAEGYHSGMPLISPDGEGLATGSLAI